MAWADDAVEVAMRTELASYEDIVSPIAAWARRRPDHPAILFEGRAVSYGELLSRVEHVAMELRGQGIRPGDRMAMLAPNTPECLINYLAAARIGAVYVPIHEDYSAREIGYMLGHAQPAIILCAAPLRPKLDEAMAGLALRPPVAAPDAFEPRAVPCDERTGEARSGNDDLVLICYTSGTTASPKGVAISHRNELASAAGFGTVWRVSHTDIVTVALPLAFLFGLHTASFVGLAHGATLLVLPRFHPRRVMEAMQAHRATTFLGVPTMYAMMTEHMTESDLRYDLSSLRLAVSSGAPLPERVGRDFRELAGLDIINYYAMSEVRPIFSPDLRAIDRVPAGSVGKLAPETEIRIVREDGEDGAVGEIGELLARGPSLMRSYYQDMVRTAEAFRDGWFKTGDLAKVDADGFYFIVGRTRDQIISGGAKIAAVEVEDILLGHSDVAAAAVIGVPDDKYGQVVKAFVVRHKQSSVTSAQLQQFCRQSLAEYKVPRIIEFAAALPMGPTGKVLKKALS